MKQKDLFYIACNCLSLDAHLTFREDIIRSFRSGKANPDEFIFQCSNHFVLPAIYLKFKKFDLLDLFPEDYSQHLREIYELNKKRNKDILSQILEINNQLKQNNIEAVFLKGTANLMDGLYSDMGERMIGDIDFLVQEKDFLKTAEILLGNGYENQFETYSDFTELKHYPRLFRKDVPADVEIHRLPVRKYYTSGYNSNMIFDNRKRVDKYDCFVPSNHHKLIHTFIHGQLSNQGYLLKIIALRDFYDYYLLSKRVDVKSVLNDIEEKNKAKKYFQYADFLIDKNKHKQVVNKFSFLHGWFLNHPKQHKCYTRIQKFIYIFFVRLISRINTVITNKSDRKDLFKKLSDWNWYKVFFNSLKIYFKS